MGVTTSLFVCCLTCSGVAVKVYHYREARPPLRKDESDALAMAKEYFSPGLETELDRGGLCVLFGARISGGTETANLPFLSVSTHTIFRAWSPTRFTALILKIHFFCVQFVKKWPCLVKNKSSLNIGVKRIEHFLKRKKKKNGVAFVKNTSLTEFNSYIYTRWLIGPR